MNSISTIIPTHNRAPFIAEAIRSALAQERPAREIIVVDDGSTDRTREEIEPFLRREQILYLHLEKAGVGAARNAGIRQASGDFVAFLDSDDRWRPHHLRQLAQALERHPERKLAFSAFEFFSSGDRSDSEHQSLNFQRSIELMLKRGFSKNPNGLWLSRDSFLSSLFEKGVPFRVQGTMIERQFLLDHRLFFDEAIPFTQDAQFITEAASHAPAVFLSDPSLEVRRHDGNYQDHGYQDKVVRSYKRRIARSKEVFQDRLTPMERRSFIHYLWDLQSAIMRIRARDRSYAFRVKEGLILLLTAPCWDSVKSLVKVLLGRPA